MIVPFYSLIGKTIVEVDLQGNQLKFKTNEPQSYKIWDFNNDAEYIKSTRNLDRLIGNKIVKVDGNKDSLLIKVRKNFIISYTVVITWAYFRDLRLYTTGSTLTAKK
jgi:hypothetical protein